MSKQIGVQANQKAVNEILAAFDRAEQALKGQDLDDLMAIYSKDYDYRGLTKHNLRDLWKDLFAKYRRTSDRIKAHRRRSGNPASVPSRSSRPTPDS